MLMSWFSSSSCLNHKHLKYLTLEKHRPSLPGNLIPAALTQATTQASPAQHCLEVHPYPSIPWCILPAPINLLNFHKASIQLWASQLTKALGNSWETLPPIRSSRDNWAAYPDQFSEWSPHEDSVQPMNSIWSPTWDYYVYLRPGMILRLWWGVAKPWINGLLSECVLLTQVWTYQGP